MAIGRFVAFVDSINERVGNLLSFLIIPIVLVASLEVVLRYVFNRPTIWAWDLNVMILGLYAIMSGGYVLLKEGHVTMDVVVAKISPRVRAILAMIAYSLFFITIGVLVWQGTLEALESVSMKEKINSAWSPPLYPLKIFWPIGAFLLLLQGVATYVRYFNTARKGESG